jgi:hypothetical protein
MISEERPEKSSAEKVVDMLLLPLNIVDEPT